MNTTIGLSVTASTVGELLAQADSYGDVTDTACCISITFINEILVDGSGHFALDLLARNYTLRAGTVEDEAVILFSLVARRVAKAQETGEMFFLGRPVNNSNLQ